MIQSNEFPCYVLGRVIKSEAISPTGVDEVDGFFIHIFCGTSEQEGMERIDETKYDDII